MGASRYLIPLTLGLGLIFAAEPSCEGDGDGDGDGYTATQGDCDDGDPNVFPGAVEFCDGIDNNCDATIDEGFDEDSDGVTTCGGDCDDGDPAISPRAEDLCASGADEDCDGAVDEGSDQDGDGVASCEGDCDDADPRTFPGAPEGCTGADNDCDGAVDEGLDLDGDGYQSCEGDCDDTNAAISPAAVEICDGVDGDCDGSVDEGLDMDGDGVTTCAGDCDDADPAVSPLTPELCNGVDDDCDFSADEDFDLDRDGVTTCEGDCDDSDPGSYAGAPEVCDGADNDCDGRRDEGFDFDSDGYTSCGGDCRDTNSGVYPGAPERCNAFDDDCDGTVDEGWDEDGDGARICDGDCDDTDPQTFPWAVETCDGVDQDCDGKADEDFDGDSDGFATCTGDCDDTRPGVNPGAYEGPDSVTTTTDGLDNDCDGYVDIDCDGRSDSRYPAVRIETPARGAFTTATSIAVKGVVYPGEDGALIQSVTLNNASMTKTRCSADGGSRFTGTANLARGINTLRVRGTDTQGDLDKAEVSIARSDRFIDMDNPVSGAIVGEMNQGTWDILSEYLETYLTAAALKTELLAANPLVNDTGTGDCLESYRLKGNATDYQHDDVVLDFTISGGKIRSTARMMRPRIWATGTAYYDLEWFCGGWDDTVDLDAYVSFSEVVATADGVFTTRSDGTIVVTFQSVVVDALGAYIDVSADGTVYDWLIDIFEDDMERELTDFVEDELRSYVAEDLGPLLSAELNELNLDYSLRVLGRDYDVAFGVENVTVPTGTVDVAFDMDLGYTKLPTIPTNPGAVGYPRSYSRSTTPTVAFKVGLDFFNASLHALWEGGSLHISEQVSTDPVIFVTAVPLLPPVAAPASGSNLLQLQIGEALMSVEVPTGSGGAMQTLDAAASATVPMNLTPIVDGDVIRFDVDFGAVVLTFDLLTEEALEPDLQRDMELGLSQMLTLYLDELEAYLEGLEISYLTLPLRFNSITVAKDPSNSAMLTLSGDAVYTGP